MISLKNLYEFFFLQGLEP